MGLPLVGWILYFHDMVKFVKFILQGNTKVFLSFTGPLHADLVTIHVFFSESALLFQVHILPILNFGWETNCLDCFFLGLPHFFKADSMIVPYRLQTLPCSLCSGESTQLCQYPDSYAREAMLASVIDYLMMLY